MIRIGADGEVCAQELALRATRWRLQTELVDLAKAAKVAAGVGTRRTPDLADVYGRLAAVRRAEEAVDFAALDLATAQGADA